jgi:hypothetical protein
MKIQKETSLEDMLDTYRRTLANTESIRAIRSRQIWTSTAAAGAAGFATWTIQALRNGDPLVRVLPIALVVATVASVSVFFVYRWWYDRTVAKHAKRIVAEQFEKLKSRHFEIEAGPESIRIRQDGMEVTHGWADLEKVTDTGDALELSFRTALVVVRRKDFASETDRTEFLEFTKAKAS